MDVFLEEHIGILPDLQGNVNVTGLVWDHGVSDDIGLDDEMYVVWVEQVEDGFGILPEFSPYHWPVLAENLALNTHVGNIPVEAYQSNLNVIYGREAAPVRIWWFGANVVHGPDTFFEEIYSNLHCRVPYTQAVPYYWKYIYESLDVEFNNIQPHPGIHVARHINTGDLINFRHTVDQQYYFNSQSYDRVGIFPRAAIGYGKHVSSEVALQAHTYRILGAPVDEHITLVDSQFFLESFHVAESLFLGDAPDYIRRFLEDAEDFYGMESETIDKFWMIHSVLDSLETSSAVSGVTARPMRVDEKVGVVAALAVLQTSQESVYDAIEVDLSTGAAHLVRDGADSDLGFADEVTSG